LPEAELYEITARVGLTDRKIVERFDCYQGTSAKAKLSKDLFVQGVNLFARKTSSSREANSHQTSSWLG
jgi:arsenite methyltransferase